MGIKDFRLPEGIELPDDCVLILAKITLNTHPEVSEPEVNKARVVAENLPVETAVQIRDLADIGLLYELDPGLRIQEAVEERFETA